MITTKALRYTAEAWIFIAARLRCDRSHDRPRLKLVTLERDNSAKRAFSELKNLAADAQALRGLNGTAHMQNHAKVTIRSEGDAAVRQLYECDQGIFIWLLRNSVGRRAFLARDVVARGLDVAYRAHYEDFQRKPTEEARRLLRAVGVSTPAEDLSPASAEDAQRPPSAVKTVKSASEDLRSQILNFDAVSRAVLAQWPCVHPQLVASGPARFALCERPPRARLAEVERDGAGFIRSRVRIIECNASSCAFALEQACSFKDNALNRARCTRFAAREACGEDDRRRCVEVAARRMGRGQRSTRITVFGIQ